MTQMLLNIIIKSILFLSIKSINICTFYNFYILDAYLETIQKAVQLTVYFSVIDTLVRVFFYSLPFQNSIHKG